MIIRLQSPVAIIRLQSPNPWAVLQCLDGASVSVLLQGWVATREGGRALPGPGEEGWLRKRVWQCPELFSTEPLGPFLLLDESSGFHLVSTGQ